MKGKDDDCDSYLSDNFGYLSIVCFKFIFETTVLEASWTLCGRVREFVNIP